MQNHLIWETPWVIDLPESQQLLKQHITAISSIFKIDSSLSRAYEGTGLGLALVKQLTEIHGRTVSIQSSVGQGSCFTVCHP